MATKERIARGKLAAATRTINNLRKELDGMYETLAVLQKERDASVIASYAKDTTYFPSTNPLWNNQIKSVPTPIVPEDYTNPGHYKRHPSGVECIEIVKHMNFPLGCAIKYIWRVDEKGDPLLNLNKAIWYLKCEISRRKKLNDQSRSETASDGGYRKEY